MKSSAYFEEAPDPAIDPEPTFGRNCNTTQKFEERALARSIATDDPHHFALIDAQGHISQGPKVHLLQFCFTSRLVPCARRAIHTLKNMTHSVNSPFLLTDDIMLAEVLDDDGGFRHSFDQCTNVVRLKSHQRRCALFSESTKRLI